MTEKNEKSKSLALMKDTNQKPVGITKCRAHTYIQTNINININYIIEKCNLLSTRKPRPFSCKLKSKSRPRVDGDWSKSKYVGEESDSGSVHCSEI